MKWNFVIWFMFQNNLFTKFSEIPLHEIHLRDTPLYSHQTPCYSDKKTSKIKTFFSLNNSENFYWFSFDSLLQNIIDSLHRWFVAFEIFDEETQPVFGWSIFLQALVKGGVAKLVGKAATESFTGASVVRETEIAANDMFEETWGWFFGQWNHHFTLEDKEIREKLLKTIKNSPEWSRHARIYRRFGRCTTIRCHRGVFFAE